MTVFGRFGRETRHVIELAEDHARALWRPAVGPDHLLLALLADDRGGILAGTGLTYDAVKTEVVGAAPEEGRRPGPGTPMPEHLPFHLRSVFRDAFRHAVEHDSNVVNPVHLALALVDDPPGEVAVLLRRLAIDVDAARRSVRSHLAKTRDPSSRVVDLRPRDDTGEADAAMGAAAGVAEAVPGGAGESEAADAGEAVPSNVRQIRIPDAPRVIAAP